MSAGILCPGVRLRLVVRSPLLCSHLSECEVLARVAYRLLSSYEQTTPLMQEQRRPLAA
jgi:hypothetical protein